MATLKSHNLTIPLFLTITLTSPTTSAQITLDGTLGQPGELAGPHYQITANQGQQVGGNLYHSFGQFNIQAGESATFSGPETVHNIISRVTGGNRSQINGPLRSTITNANLYLLNPAGILFGEGAELDVQGSFYASTAHTLRFADGAEFSAITPTPPHSILTVAPVTAFGFLNDTVAPITVATGRGKITDWNSKPRIPTGLSVPEGKTLALIGGNIDIKNGTFYETQKTKNGNTWPEAIRLGSLTAPYGIIHLASVNSKGQVIPTNTDLDVSSCPQLGKITISDKSLIDVSGRGAGKIFLRAGQLAVHDSDIYANTRDDQDGGSIDIQVDTLSFLKDWRISASTRGTGKGAAINILARHSALFSGEEDYGITGIGAAKTCSEEENRGPSRIMTTSCCEEASGGDAGNLSITAGNLTFKDGAYISGNTYGGGKASDVTLKSTGTITFLGANKDSGIGSSIYLRTKNSRDEGVGNAGNLNMEANQVLFKDGAQITARTQGGGNGGNVTINAKESVTFAGESQKGYTTEIFVTSKSEETNQNTVGNAGHLHITAKDILFEGGADITGSTFTKGKGGDVTLQASDSVTFSGESTSKYRSNVFLETLYPEEGAGDAGNLRIEANNISFRNGGMIFSATKGKGKAGNVFLHATGMLSLTGEAQNEFTDNIDGKVLYPNFYASGLIGIAKKESTGGQGGLFEINAGEVILSEGATITTSTESLGKAGQILLHTPRLTVTGTNSRNGQASSLSSSSDSDQSAAGDAGEIHLSANLIQLTQGGTINTAAKHANGGNITITSFPSSSPNLLYLRHGSITTDVDIIGGHGNGGTITIDKIPSVVLDNSHLNANAYEGNGGYIRIVAEQFIKTPNSKVTASSTKRIDGRVEIHAQEIQIGEIETLTQSFKRDVVSFNDWCKQLLRGDKSASYFMQNNRLGIPYEMRPGGVLGSYFDWKPR